MGILSISWEPPLETLPAHTGSMAIGVPHNRVRRSIAPLSYQPQYREVNGNWINLPVTRDTRVEIELPEGAYEARVMTIQPNGVATMGAMQEVAVTRFSYLRYPYGTGIMVIL